MSSVTARRPATASVDPIVQGAPRRFSGRPARRRMRSIRVSVTMAIARWPFAGEDRAFTGTGGRERRRNRADDRLCGLRIEAVADLHRRLAEALHEQSASPFRRISMTLASSRAVQMSSPSFSRSLRAKSAPRFVPRHALASSYAGPERLVPLQTAGQMSRECLGGSREHKLRASTEGLWTCLWDSTGDPAHRWPAPFMSAVSAWF